MIDGTPPGCVPAPHRRNKAAWVSLAVSLSVHALIAVTALVAVWTVTLPPRDAFADVTVSFFDPAPTGVILTEPETAPLESTSTPPPMTHETPPPAPTLSEKVAAGSGMSAPEPRATEGADRGAEARREMVESRSFAEVRFAGLGAGNARSIIYVVDASGSMVTTFARVKDDLKRSIFKLSPTQRFQVIFFTRGSSLEAVLPRDELNVGRPRGLIRATPENIRAVSAWIDTIRPAGAGNPIPALENALALRPEAMFVLSSVIPGMGEWKPDKDQVLSRLEQLNPRGVDGRRPVVIKTIQYLDADPQGILQAIAEAHGGSDGYNFIKRAIPPR